MSAQIERRNFLKTAATATGAIAATGVSGAAQAVEQKKTSASQPKPAAPMKFIATDGAPKAIGPYSQAVLEGGLLFVSGQIPLDPGSGELVTASLDAAVDRIFDNLEAVLRAAGLSFVDVVKTTVYLTRSEDFAPMNAVYGRRMGDHRPARSTVIVAALPRSAPVEIDLIARVKP